MRRPTEFHQHACFEAQVAAAFSGAVQVVGRTLFDDYRQDALAYLGRKFGPLSPSMRYERSAEFLGQLAEQRDGLGREHALRLRDELLAILAEKRRRR